MIKKASLSFKGFYSLLSDSFVDAVPIFEESDALEKGIFCLVGSEQILIVGECSFRHSNKKFNPYHISPQINSLTLYSQRGTHCHTLH